jgi:hypothetical protein
MALIRVVTNRISWKAAGSDESGLGLIMFMSTTNPFDNGLLHLLLHTEVAEWVLLPDDPFGIKEGVC